MKNVYDFAGYSKQDINKKINEYIKFEWRGTTLSYLFILLSSSLPFFSLTNGAIYVLIWYTIAHLLSVFLYVSQGDYKVRRKKASHSNRRHKKSVVKLGTNIKPEIGGENLLASCFVSACLVVIVLSPFVIYKQFNDYNQYMRQYKDLCLGIIADTYIVTLFSIIFKLFVVSVCDFIYDASPIVKKLLALKFKYLLKCLAISAVAFWALYYYFCNEFCGLFENTVIRKLLGLVYILFMVYPGVKQIINAIKSKRLSSRK